MDPKQEKEKAIPGLLQGADEYFIDVDRMINEGMAGGTESLRYDHEQIEQARELKKEEPPHKVE